MPWPFGMDAEGRSLEREQAIAECKRLWSYESPWPDFEAVDLETRSYDVYGRLRIPYDENLDALSDIAERYVSEWQPLTENDGYHYCKNPAINVSYPEYDAFILYCFVRQYRPQRIIELGSGMSTRVIVDAAKKNGGQASITCVDKYAESSTKELLGRLGVEFLDKDIVSTDLSIYESLQKNDILFIDSSHVLKNYGDVEFEFMSVLPSLKPGVIIHVHDIFLPFNYHPTWIIDWKCVLTEQQVLGAYLHDNNHVKILAANNYNCQRRLCVPDEIEFKFGGSFWFQIK